LRTAVDEYEAIGPTSHVQFKREIETSTHQGGNALVRGDFVLLEQTSGRLRNCSDGTACLQLSDRTSNRLWQDGSVDREP
jgi:hypothetical protein